jgi:hypothetical protein
MVGKRNEWNCPKALDYTHWDPVSVAVYWPEASPLRGVNTVNCTKLLMQLRAVSENRKVQGLQRVI